MILDKEGRPIPGVPMKCTCGNHYFGMLQLVTIRRSGAGGKHIFFAEVDTRGNPVPVGICLKCGKASVPKAVPEPKTDTEIISSNPIDNPKPGE